MKIDIIKKGLTKKFAPLALIALISLPVLALWAASRTASPEGAKVYIISPKDGETVGSTFTVRFGLSGMGIAPAGVERENTGHHHLLIDYEGLPSFDEPMGGSIKHFGGGQSETQLTLEPGKHTLQLIMGDHLHRPHDPPVISEKITIRVK